MLLRGEVSVALAVGGRMHCEHKEDDGPETRRLACHPRMNHLLKKLFFGLALALMAIAAILWFNLQSTGLHPLQSKTFWLTVACGCSVALAGWKFSTETKLKILLVLLSLGFMELLLQVSGWLALLPAVNTKERLPFGRGYWTSEGLGNSIRNRFGWYYPEFELRKTNRLAVIGDSFVEAVEVHRTRNMSAVLAGRMHGRNETPEVLGLGNHGTGPAQYLEVLQYAHRH